MIINKDSINTEIGDILFKVSALEGDVSRASITISNIEPLLPEGMVVEGSIGVLLALNSSTDIKDFKFSCSWNGNNTRGYACSGEGLEAWEWENDGQLVVIGTEDGEWLSERINLGEPNQDNYPIFFEENCITINLRKYSANKELTLHFVVANSSLPEKEECSCWYAVDVTHQRVIEACKS